MKRIALESLVKALPIDFDPFGNIRGAFEEHDYFEHYAKQLRIRASFWSIYQVIGRMEEPIPVAAKRVRYFDHWGDKDVVVKLRSNATWLDLWRAANEAIKKSGDRHHTFIESFEVDGDTLILYTGS